MHWSRIGTALALSLGLWGTVSLTARAIQLTDGTVFFASPPRLEGASVSQNAAYFGGASYFFTLTVPETAGEPLQKVMIAPEVNVSRAYFDLSETQAYEGTRRRSGAKLPIRDVTITPENRGVTVTFDPPVPAGKTITIELYADRNPDTGGVYLYGITAYPAGEKAHGQFLGYGRIHIYDRDRIFFSHPYYRRW